MNTESETRHSIEDLARLTEFPVRTIRYYIEEGLVGRPVGEKRTAYYTARHLEQLLTIRKWQSAGLSLERIRELLSEPDARDPPAAPAARPGNRRSVEPCGDCRRTGRSPSNRAGPASARNRSAPSPAGLWRCTDRSVEATTNNTTRRKTTMLDTNQEPSALLRDANGRPVALTGVSVRGRLSETHASVEVEQRYLNPFDHNIEAVTPSRCPSAPCCSTWRFTSTAAP